MYCLHVKKRPRRKGRITTTTRPLKERRGQKKGSPTSAVSPKEVGGRDDAQPGKNQPRKKKGAMVNLLSEGQRKTSGGGKKVYSRQPKAPAPSKKRKENRSRVL